MAAAGILVTRLVTGTQIGIAMNARVSIGGRAGEANRHAIMQNNAHARRMLRRLSGGGVSTAACCVNGKRAGSILGCRDRAQAESREREKDNQRAFQHDHHVHNKSGIRGAL